MEINQWLKDIYYDDYGQYLWSKQDEDGGSQIIGEVRGWGAIQQLFKTHKECAEFQDKVGKFIADAINEKVNRELPQQEISDEEIEIASEPITNIGNRRKYWEEGAKWYREQLIKMSANQEK